MVKFNAQDDGSYRIVDESAELIYRPYEVIAPTGDRIAHYSRGGDLHTVASCSVGSAFAEISFLGNGPAGGELVLVITPADGPNLVFLGALVTGKRPPSAAVTSAWASTLDLALNLVTNDTVDSGSKNDIEEFLQYLVGELDG